MCLRHGVASAEYRPLLNCSARSALGSLRFAELTRPAEERSVRLRDSAAVVAGRTWMVTCYQGDEVTVQGRYTQVYANESGRWRLMPVQGTPTGLPG
jgi:hypothetical protein